MQFDRTNEDAGKDQDLNLVAELRKIGRRCSELPDLDTRDGDEIMGYNEIGAFD